MDLGARAISPEFNELSSSHDEHYSLPYRQGGDGVTKKGSNFEDLLSLGRNIEIERISAGLSQEELAKKVGVNRSTIARIEKGSDSVAVGTLLDICSALAVTLAQLLTERKPEEMIDPDMRRIQIFTANLKNEMRRKGVNPVELARKSDIPMGTLRTYLLGTRIPNPKNLKAIGDALGMKGSNLWLKPEEDSERAQATPPSTQSSIMDEKINREFAAVRNEFAQLKGFIEGLLKK